MLEQQQTRCVFCLGGCASSETTPCAHSLFPLPSLLQEEDNYYTNAELIERRRMESEIQANEDEERRRKREVWALWFGSNSTVLNPKASLALC